MNVMQSSVRQNEQLGSVEEMLSYLVQRSVELGRPIKYCEYRRDSKVDVDLMRKEYNNCLPVGIDVRVERAYEAFLDEHPDALRANERWLAEEQVAKQVTTAREQRAARAKVNRREMIEARRKRFKGYSDQLNVTEMARLIEKLSTMPWASIVKCDEAGNKPQQERMVYNEDFLLEILSDIADCMDGVIPSALTIKQLTCSMDIPSYGAYTSRFGKVDQWEAVLKRYHQRRLEAPNSLQPAHKKVSPLVPADDLAEKLKDKAWVKFMRGRVKMKCRKERYVDPEQCLEILSDIVEVNNNYLPSNEQLSSLHKSLSIPGHEVFLKKLGQRECWIEQINEYRKQHYPEREFHPINTKLSRN